MLSQLSTHVAYCYIHTGDAVTFLNERVQQQFGSSDCGLFALAFATDLCHGLDPTKRNYIQGLMRKHYVDCLESGKMAPFPTTDTTVPRHPNTKKTKIPIFCDCRLPNEKKKMSCVGNVLAGIIKVVHKYQSGQSTRKESGNAKHAKIAEL